MNLALKRPSNSSLSQTLPAKTLTFPNKAKLSNLLCNSLKQAKTPSKAPEKPAPAHASNPELKGLKSNSISYSGHNGSSILIFGSNPSIIQINNFLPVKNSNSNAKPSKKEGQEHKRTFTTADYDLAPDKEAVNMPFSARIENTKGILDHKASLPILGSKTLEKFGVNLKALMSAKKNPKFQKPQQRNPQSHDGRSRPQNQASQSPVKATKLTGRDTENPIEKVISDLIQMRRERKPDLDSNETVVNGDTSKKGEDYKDLMGSLLRKTRRLLEIYSLKEKKWLLEREALRQEISALKHGK